MDADIKKMRIKQLLFLNGSFVILMALFFSIPFLITIQFSTLFLILGFVILIQAVVVLWKGDSTKAIIPLFEEVAIYEKRKMGREWLKRKRSEAIWQLFVSAFMFLQYYLSRDLGNFVHWDLTFITIVAIVALILFNTGFIMHFRKIDQTINESDLEGYTWKSSLLSGSIGLVVGGLLFVVVLFYII